MSARTPVAYATMNSILTGVGASQVLPYITGLAALGHPVRMLSFETSTASRPTLPSRLEWRPRPFSRGHFGSAKRVAAMCRFSLANRDRPLHARSDLAAFAAAATRHPKWIWDMRAFWREQRIYLGSVRPDSSLDRCLKTNEGIAAVRSAAIIALSEAAIPILAERYGEEVASKVHVIPTAVDTDRFEFAPPAPGAEQLRVVVSGSLNALYDGVTIGRFVEGLSGLIPVRSEWLGANPRSPWYSTLSRTLTHLESEVPYAEVPSKIAGAHAALVICQPNAGPALAGAMPTKAAEHLAAGTPLIASSGIGDLDQLITQYRCGVIIKDQTPQAIDTSVRELLALLTDPGLAARCRDCAVDHFDLRGRVQQLSALYESL